MIGTSRLALCIAILLPVLVATALYLPSSLSASWLSDDFAYATLLTTEAPTPRLEWSEVGRQLHERWLFSHAYWRPMVTALCAANFTIAPDATSFALVNLALHLAAIVGVALLCARLCDGPRAAVAAALGGMIFAMHPLAGESVLWISARVSTLEVAFGAWSLWLFARHVHEPARHRLLPAAIAFAAALLSKESAIVLPLGFVAIETLRSSPVAVGVRIRRHAQLAIVWISYLVLRVALLGSVGGGELPTPSIVDVSRRAGAKLEVLVAADRTMTVGAGLALVTAMILAWHSGRSRRRLLDLVIAVSWAVFALAPAFAHEIDVDLVGARLGYAAVIPLAVIVSRGLATHVAGVCIAIAFSIAGLPTTLAVTGRYRAAYATTRGFVEGIATRAPSATVGSTAVPIGILSAPPTRGVSGVIHPATVFALGELPFAPRVQPILALGGLLAPTPSTLDGDPTTPDLFGDPSPVHALLHHRSAVAYWSAGTQSLAWLSRSPRPSDPLTPDAAGLCTFESARGLLDAEVAILETSVEASGGRLVWQTTHGEFDGPAALTLPAPVSHDGTHEFIVDLTRHAPLLVGAIAGVEWTGLRIALDRGVVRSVRLMPALPSLSGVPRTDGRTVPLAELPLALQLEEQPFAGARELVLCTPSASYVIAVEPSGYPRFTERILADLQAHLGALRGERVVWFARAYGRRSAFDHVRLTSP